MQITHNEITAGLWSLVAASGYIAGVLTRWLPSKRRLDREFDWGYDRGWEERAKLDDELDEVLDRARDDLTEHGVSAVSYLGVAEEQLAKHEQSYRDGELFDRPGARQAQSDFKNVPRPPCPSCGLYPPVHGSACEIYRSPLAGSGPGHYPDGREYPTDPGPTVSTELAALADGPESDSPAFASEGAPVDPHWYANGLHALADWQAEWHEDAARFDAWLPGYLDWYRRSLEPSWSQASRMLEAL